MTEVITINKKQELSHPTASVYIKSSKGKAFNSTCSAYHTDSEVRNMKWHLSQAASKPSLYDFIDLETAQIIVETDLPVMSDDELLDALGV